MTAAEPEPGTAASPPPPASPPFLRPGERLPWVLRPPTRATKIRPQDREADQLAALAARRTALLVIPAVGVGWVLIAVLAGEDALRIATIVALVVCVALGVRAAVTTQRFRRHLDPALVAAPPAWVTLATVAAAIAAVVAVANVVADLQADRPATGAIVFGTIALAVVGLGAYAHIAGGRSVGAALRTRPNDHVN